MPGRTPFRPRSKPQIWLAAFLIIPGIILFFCPSLTFGQCSTGNFGAAGTFITSPQPITNSRPAAIAAGDFNSDGKVDLATASRSNTGGGTVATLLGDGTGGFGTASEVNLSSTQTVVRDPHAIVAGDFNKDGNLDLATANYASKNISVLLGDGTGRFSTERINVIPIRGYPTSIAASDFNNDGNLDLVTTNPLSVRGGSVSVLFGDGTGNFSGSNGEPENNYPISYDDPSSVTVGDFNGDARQDFAVVGSHRSTYPNVPSYVSVFMGHGRGNFAPAYQFRVVTNRDHTVSAVGPHGIATADFNRDGKQDLVVGLSYMTFTYAGDGGGGFSLASMFEHGLSPTVSVGDFNGDMRLDLVRTFNGAGTVAVDLGDGMGRFGAPTRFPVGVSSGDIVVSDFNGDGKHDVAGSNYSANNIWVLLNTCSSAPLPNAHFLVAEEFSNRVIAFDSVTMVGGPFPVNSPYNLSTDKRTRLILFARDMDSTSAPTVTAQLVDYNNVVYSLTVESVGTVPLYNWLTRVVVKLPDGLAGGRDALISISVNGVESNKAILSIRPPIVTSP